MQVSWIDPDEVRELLTKLEGPKQAAAASAWEVHTLPATPVASSSVEPLMSEEASTDPADSHPEEPSLGEHRGGPPNAELWRIRERLRVLRDKAQTAGIFSRQRQDEPAPAPQGVETTPAPVIRVEPVEVPAPQPAAAEPFQPIEAFTASLPSSPVEETQAPPLPAAVSLPIESPFELVEAPPEIYEPLFGTLPPSLEKSNEAAQALPDIAPAPLSTATPTAVGQPPFEVANLGLSERLNAVAEWVCTRLGTREVLLVDDYGDVLWGAQGQTALVLSAMMAWHSAHRASASSTCIDPERIDKALPPDRALTVLPLRTRFGVVSLAVIHRTPVSEDDAAAIRKALTLAVEGPASSGSYEGA